MKPIEVVPGLLDDAETLVYGYLAEHGPTDAATIGAAIYPIYKEGKIDWYPDQNQWGPWARRILWMLISRGMVRENEGKFEVVK